VLTYVITVLCEHLLKAHRMHQSINLELPFSPKISSVNMLLLLIFFCKYVRPATLILIQYIGLQQQLTYTYTFADWLELALYEFTSNQLYIAFQFGTTSPSLAPATNDPQLCMHDITTLSIYFRGVFNLLQHQEMMKYDEISTHL